MPIAVPCFVMTKAPPTLIGSLVRQPGAASALSASSRSALMHRFEPIDASSTQSILRVSTLPRGSPASPHPTHLYAPIQRRELSR